MAHRDDDIIQRLRASQRPADANQAGLSRLRQSGTGSDESALQRLRASVPPEGVIAGLRGGIFERTLGLLAPKKVGQFVRDLPDIGRGLLQVGRSRLQDRRDEQAMLGDPRLEGATREHLVAGRVSRPEPEPFKVSDLVGGDDISTSRKIGRGIGEGLTFAAGGAAFNRIKSTVRAVRAARAAKPVQKLLPQFAESLAPGRVAAQETADVAGGLRETARRARVAEGAGSRLVEGVTPRRSRIQQALSEGLDEAGAPVSPSRVGLRPEPFGTRPGPVQPEVFRSRLPVKKVTPTVTGGTTGPDAGVTPTPAPRVAPTPATGPSRGISAETATPRSQGSGARRPGRVFSKETSGDIHAVIDTRPDGRLLVMKTNRVAGTREPSFWITPDKAKDLNFAKGRGPGSRAFDKTGEVAPRIQDVKRGLNSDQGFVQPGLLAGIAGGGVGAAVGAVNNPDERLGGALMGGMVGLAAVMGLRGAMSPRNVGKVTKRLSPRNRQRLARASEAILTVRREVFLSGGAIPKNVMTAMGALPIAALETGSFAPLKQLPRLVKDVAKAFVKPSSIKGGIPLEQGQRLVGPVSKRIGAIDQVAENALRRGVPGITQAQIDRALVKTPLAKTLGRDSDLIGMLRSGIGKFVFPFQRTPFDVAVGGATEIVEAFGGKAVRGALGTSARRKALTVASAGAGAGVGEALGDEGIPGAIGASFLAAALGRRAVPFGLAAGITGGPQFLRGISPTPEFALNVPDFIPTSLDDIAFFRLLDQMSGR